MPAEVLGLPKKLHFTSSDKVIELVQRGGGFTEQESRLMLNQAIVTGRGGVFPEPPDTFQPRTRRKCGSRSHSSLRVRRAKGRRNVRHPTKTTPFTPTLHTLHPAEPLDPTKSLSFQRYRW